MTRNVLLPVIAVVGVALGATAARPEMRSWLGWESTSSAREIDLEKTTEAAIAPAPERVESKVQQPTTAADPEAPAELTVPEVPIVQSARVEASPAAASLPSEKPAADQPAGAPDDSLGAMPVEGTASADAAPPAPAKTATTELKARVDDPAELSPFDTALANVALNEATVHAASCRREGDPSGIARVVITFAPSGRATSATLSGPPFSGTETGSCIAARFRAATVPAFSGEHATVTKTVTIQ